MDYAFVGRRRLGAEGGRAAGVWLEAAALAHALRTGYFATAAGRATASDDEAWLGRPYGIMAFLLWACAMAAAAPGADPLADAWGVVDRRLRGSYRRMRLSPAQAARWLATGPPQSGRDQN